MDPSWAKDRGASAVLQSLSRMGKPPWHWPRSQGDLFGGPLAGRVLSYCFLLMAFKSRPSPMQTSFILLLLLQPYLSRNLGSFLLFCSLSKG